MQAGDGGDEAQAQPGAGLGAARFEAHETAHRAVAIGLGNAGAAIGDGDLGAIAGDRAASIVMRHGVRVMRVRPAPHT